MELEKGVQEEIEKFEEILPCKEKHKIEGKVCLPAYLVLQNIEFNKLDAEEVRQLTDKGVALYKRLTEKGKKKHFDNLYRFINEKLRELLYPGERDIKWECQNADCPAYSIIREMEGGKGFIEYMIVQYAAIDVFKHKIGEVEHRDIGFANAVFRWTQEPIIIDGKVTDRAAEYSKAYNEEKAREILGIPEKA